MTESVKVVPFVQSSGADIAFEDMREVAPLYLTAAKGEHILRGIPANTAIEDIGDNVIHWHHTILSSFRVKLRTALDVNYSTLEIDVIPP